MATNEQKEKLMEVLKFTPRTYTISLWGYGGEKVMGTVDKEAWDYCLANQVDLSDIAWSDEETVAEEMGLDVDKLPFPPGQWYECDNMAHVNGVSRDAGTVQVLDENSDTVIESSLEAFDGGTGSLGWCCNDEAWIGSRRKGEIVFIGSSNEKGTFFEGEIELTAPFDIELLELHYDEVDGEEIVNSVYYDGEEIDNNGGGTDGKSSDFNMVRLTDDDGNFERYEPGEKDWGVPACGPGPDNWEKSPEFDYKKYKPVHVGWYNCVWGTYGTTYGTAYWDGVDFVEFEYGKPNLIVGMKTWQGYNWDTSDWANQPKEPTKAEFIAMLDNALAELAEESGIDFDDESIAPDCKCVQCNWIGSVDDTDYTEHGMSCPECHSAVEILEANDDTGTTVAPKGSWPF